MPEPTWMAAARKELGQHEAVGAAHNPRIVAYHQATSLHARDDETPWCSAFANWCMEQAGINGTGRANARSWLTWGAPLKAPRSGCVVVFSRPPSPTDGHVAFYVSDYDDRVLVLGGNQGDAVNVAAYPKSRVLAYRWPNAEV